MGATDDLIQASKKDTRQHIDQVAAFLEQMRSELERRKAVHDESKLCEPELSGYATCVPLFKGTEYGSPEYKAVVAKMRPAVDHHYDSNRHHPEFHGKASIKGMHLIDIIEMICDWKAAAIRAGNLDKFEENLTMNFRRFKVEPQLAAVMKNTLGIF